MELSKAQRKQAMNRATWWGILVNLLLSIAKLIFGFIGHSQALIADGLHSLSDLISDGMVLLATHHASAEADEDHPYGHERYETLATIALGVLLIAVAIGIGINAFDHLLNPAELIIPSTLTLWVAGLSIASKEVLFHYTMLIARKVKSKMLEANAWHHRSDAISSIVVFVGITGAILGWPMLDAIAALIVSLMIVKIGWELSHHGIKELVDTALEPKMLDAIKQAILQVDGVQHLHLLRTRRMGHNALVDVHILVDERLSVSEGHQISEAVAAALTSGFSDINDVTVHIDPEDDEVIPNSCRKLPLRSELLHQLAQHWQAIPETAQIENTVLHYLNGKVSIEIFFPLSTLETPESAKTLHKKISDASHKLDHIGDVDIYFK